MKTSPALLPNLRLLLVLSLLAWFMFASRMSAQWGHAADVQTPVCAIVGASVFNTRVISDGEGGMFAVWRDTRNSATGQDIYAQRIGSNGRALWTANGVEVCRTAGIQELPILVADGAGGVMIVWQDHRVFNDGRSHLFAQRLDGSGNPLWAANGVRVSTSVATQHTAVISPPVGFVGTGNNVIIPGFVMSGDATMRVLVRAVGPTLGTFGVDGVVNDPKFDFFGPGNTMVGSNDNWSSNAGSQAAVEAAQQFTARSRCR